MDPELIRRNRHLFQRPVKEEIELFDENFDIKIIIKTDCELPDCVFLKSDNTCAIYDHRPDLCKKYGLSSGIMECPNVTPEGKIRSPKEREKVILHQQWYILKKRVLRNVKIMLPD